MQNGNNSVIHATHMLHTATWGTWNDTNNYLNAKLRKNVFPIEYAWDVNEFVSRAANYIVSFMRGTLIAICSNKANIYRMQCPRCPCPHSLSLTHKHFCSLFLRAIHIFRFQSELVWGGGQRTNKRNDENSWIPFWMWRYVLFAIRSHSIVIPWYAFVICASRSASEEDQQWTCTNDTIHVRNASTILFPKWSLEFSVITSYHSEHVKCNIVHLTFNI